MKQFLIVLRLLWVIYSGSHLRERVRRRIGLPPTDHEAMEMDLGALPLIGPTNHTGPVGDLGPHGAQGPEGQDGFYAGQIIVPDPAHADDHGPASSVARALIRAGHQIYSADSKPGNLNIVTIRNSDRDFDVFKCQLVHFWKHQGEWQMESWPITTYPGKYYTVDKLLSPLGAAILAPGQFHSAYQLDYHRGAYEALCQRGGSVPVYRDKDRDRVYDLDPLTIQEGSFGINFHATQNPDGAPANHVASRVHAASAGCQVFARISDFVEGRAQWRIARNHFGNSFSPSLIERSALDDGGTVPIIAAKPQIDEAPTSAWFPTGINTVGVRNRNLLNVKGCDQWKYSLGTDSKGHHIFPSFAKGLRAGLITLRSYYVKHELRTIYKILARWAPATDTIGSIPGAPANAPALYAKAVARRMGLKPTDQLMTFRPDGSIHSADQLYALVSGMVAYENAAHLELPRHVFDEALALI